MKSSSTGVGLTGGSGSLVFVCAGCFCTLEGRGSIDLADASTDLVVRGATGAGCFFGGGRTTLGFEAVAFVTTGFADDFGLAVGSEAGGSARTLLVDLVCRPEEAATRDVAGLGFGKELGLFTAAGLTGAETLPLRGAWADTPVD